MAETRTLLEAFITMSRFQYNSKGGQINIFTENKQLYRILNKTMIQHTDIEQGSGDYVQKVNQIRNKLAFLVSNKFVKKQDDLVDFNTSPE